ncbi:ATP-binding protein [Rhodoferax sp. PAMC 29310]|uniref:sensor histidine kinase n=1 Tax=Rhodoferax sp. PAMC 29310 TaxID=2822760 RepID=UPI001B33FDF0|nr:ATP-binding protein [Rhodoferax sp. PAMC 29310]
MTATSARSGFAAAFITFALAVVLVLAAAWLAYGAAHQRTLDEMQSKGTAQIEYHTRELLSAVERFKNLPALLGADASLLALLQAPDNTANINAANNYLSFAQVRSGVSHAYLIDAQGQTRAASNWQQPDSFVGFNYGFRPYFMDAMTGKTGVFYAIGVTTGEPGAFIAAPIRAGNRVLGVVAVKIDLTEIEDSWVRSSTPLALTDRYGVLFLSAHPEWRYRSLDTLSSDALEELQRTRQYGDIAQNPLRSQPGPMPARQGETLRADHQTFLVLGRPIESLGWHLLLFSNPERAVNQGLLVAALAGLATALTLAGAGLGWQYRRRRSDRLAARHELAQVVAALDERIATRTAELTAANDTAVQTGKLALLGQMAAGISHEISQPLAALRTMADNASVFLSRDDTPSARKNLAHIGDLCTRMGNIVGELKAFARKEPARLHAVPLSGVISSALMLIEPHRHAANAHIKSISTNLWVMGDSIRLEQVLVNLIRNGIDAMEDQPQRQLDIHLVATEAEVTLSIRDHGPGLSPQAQAHLFEPFFTTKPSGKGLGLGLALSQAIVKEMGATLTACNVAPGAQFDLTLRRAPDHE